MKSSGQLVRKLTVFVLITLALVFFLFPIYWLVRTGGLSMGQIFSARTFWFPLEFSTFLSVWRQAGFPEAYLHSILISTSSTILTIAISIPAAFSLVRLSTKKAADRFLDSLLVAIALPPVVLLVPFYILMSNLGLVDTLPALTLVNIVFNLPFCVWLIYSFFRDLPIEIEESGMVDGCSRLGAFFRLSLPLSITGLAVAAILVFIASWNEFLFALVLTRRDAVTAPIAILDFVLGRGGGGAAPNWNLASAAGLSFMVPILILAVFVNKYLVKALTLGAVKQ